ncbi:MAG: anhydro-N-acetylmuramic acid kinase, partial [Phycisphaerae bacterium]|nr:anhydro-N-acetylmuramic acid kinase [Phycisphaerae bacterium]
MKEIRINSKWSKLAAGLSEKPVLRTAGLMSGTSADGIDAAIIDFGAKKIDVLAFDTFGYPAKVRKMIFELFDPQKATIEKVSHLNFVMGELFADAVKNLCKKSGIEISTLDLIGSHGQTIFHNPAGKRFGGKIIHSTFQIAEPCVIAQRTGVLTVADFRTADIAAGGQGAPLVPYTDYILFSHKKKNR